MNIVPWDTREQPLEIEGYYSSHSNLCIKTLQFVLGIKDFLMESFHETCKIRNEYECFPYNSFHRAD